MKTVNYSGINKILEFGIKLKSDEEVYNFFKTSKLSFEYLQDLFSTNIRERRHIIQRIPETISVSDYYTYHKNKNFWDYKTIQGQKVPCIGKIDRFCYKPEYRLLVEFYPILSEKNIKYNLLKPMKENIYIYSGYFITFKNPGSKNIAIKPYIHKLYVTSLMSSVINDNIEHYSIEDDE